MKAFATAALILAFMNVIQPPAAAASGNVGDFAPDFQLENVLDGAPDIFTLSDHRGSVVVIAFFAYW
jgi:hypothetical protein